MPSATWKPHTEHGRPDPARRDAAIANGLQAAARYDVEVSERSWRELGKPGS
jgi:hypothetical protein